MTDHQRSLLQRLAGADSASIANIIELFEARPNTDGYAGTALKSLYPDLPPAVGYAVTATYRTGYLVPETPPHDEMMARLFDLGAAHPGPAIAVFQDLDEPICGVTFGEIMATSFQSFGFAGLMTSGAVRDLEPMRALHLPCWATGVLVSHGYAQILEAGVPVHVAGLSIETGDLLHGDASGVVSIPLAIAEGVAQLIEPYLAAEAELLAAVQADTLDTAAYRRAAAQFGERLHALRERARKNV